MTTGGIARPSVAQRVLDSGVAVAGIATAMAEVPDLPRRWQTGAAPHALPAPVTAQQSDGVARPHGVGQAPDARAE